MALTIYEKQQQEMDEVEEYLTSLEPEKLATLSEILEKVNNITNNTSPSVIVLLQILDNM